MPRAEDRRTPQGLPKGSVKQEQQFVQQTGGANDSNVGSGSDPAAMAAMPEATQSNVKPSPVTQPTLIPEPDEGFQAPKPDQTVPNIDPATGMNMDDILFGPTQRPLEPVTSGLGGGGAGQAPTPTVSATISALMQQSPSRDLQALLEAAQNAGA